MDDQPAELPSEVKKFVEPLLSERIEIRVPKDFRSVHEFTRQSRVAMDHGYFDNYGRTSGSREYRSFRFNLTKTSIRRGLLLMDAVVRTLETLGAKVTRGEKESYNPSISIFGEDVCLELVEKVVREERPLTEEEKASKYVWDRWIYKPTGNLYFRTSTYGGKTWSDKKRKALEDQLAEVVIGVVLEGYHMRESRLRQIEEEKRRHEEHLRWLEQERQREQEQTRRDHFKQKAQGWFLQLELKKFIQHCEEGLPGTDESREWLRWARGYVEELDPLSSAQRIQDLIRVENEEFCIYGNSITR